MEANIAEIWQPLTKNERYEVSTTGKVWDTEYCVLLNQTGNKGYKYVNLKLNGTYQSIGVHRLVIFTFWGIMTTKKQQCNHKDGIKSNNNLHNLEIVSPGGNIQHAYDMGLNPGAWSKYKIKFKEELRRSKF